MNMTVLRSFALLKERTGVSSTSIDVEETTLVADVLAALIEFFLAIEHHRWGFCW
mgnify:CR=1 FL=1